VIQHDQKITQAAFDHLLALKDEDNGNKNNLMPKGFELQTSSIYDRSFITWTAVVKDTKPCLVLLIIDQAI